MVLFCLFVCVLEIYLCLKCVWVVLNYYLLMFRILNELIKGKLVVMVLNFFIDIELFLFVL